MPTAVPQLALFAQAAFDISRSGLPAWVLPLWVLCVGVLVGLLIATAIYATVALISREAGAVIEDLVLRGLFKPLFLASLAPALFALLLMPWAPTLFVVRSLWPGFWSAEDPFGAILLGELVLWPAGTVLGTFLLAILLRVAFPKVAAVALTTAKEGMAQPLFWVLVSLGAFLLLAFIWIPYNTFGEDIKMLKQQGLELLMLLALLLSVTTASVSVAQEIEGRTALTVLSKPIGRRQFIIGKFLGVVAPVFLLFLLLGFVYLGTVSYKVVYESLETGQGRGTIVECALSMAQTMPGLVLKFLGAMCMAAISVAISTRLPMLANLSICFVIYIVGHLMPLVVESAVGQRLFEPVQFVAQLIATVLPMLANFDVQAGIAGDELVPGIYLLHATVYGLVYCLFVLCGALFLFEDRDLA